MKTVAAPGPRARKERGFRFDASGCGRYIAEIDTGQPVHTWAIEG